MSAPEPSSGLKWTIIWLLVGTAVFHEDRRAVWVLAAIASAMVVIGAFLPSIYPDLTILICNRALSLGAVFATALFMHHARAIQDRLTDQTLRAEAAEQILEEELLFGVKRRFKLLHQLLIE